MGIGSDNVYKIKTCVRGKMMMDHLESEIGRSKAEGAVPFMVSATGGTTVLGAFDPIDEIADICQRHNIWLHVDAAWGGGVLMSTKHRKLLDGIERSATVLERMLEHAKRSLSAKSGGNQSSTILLGQ